MAKKYAVTFVAIAATFERGFVSMDMMDIAAPFKTEDAEVEAANVAAWLKRFSDEIPATHVASVRMTDRRARKFPGFDKISELHAQREVPGPSRALVSAWAREERGLEFYGSDKETQQQLIEEYMGETFPEVETVEAPYDPIDDFNYVGSRHHY